MASLQAEVEPGDLVPASGVTRLLGMASERRPGLQVIGAMKLLKGVGLLVVGVGLLSMLHRDAAETVRSWIEFLRIDAHAHLVERLIAKVAGISHNTLRSLGVGTLFYAVVFGTEGVGLLLGQSWAEYMTTLVTVSFLPIEGYELITHPSLLKGLVILINAAVVVYLVLEIRRRRNEARVQMDVAKSAQASIL